MTECGTYSGYQNHRGEPCQPCKDAQAAYVAHWRRRNPDRQRQHVAKQHVRDKALRRLAKMYPAEFRVLYDEELRKQRGDTP